MTFLLYLSIVLTSPGEAAALDDALATITKEDVHASFEKLTSDEFAGRGTPQRGLTKAEDWVASRFKDAGLEAMGSDGSSFLRNYGVKAVSVDATSTLALSIDGQDSPPLALDADFVPADGSKDGSAEGEVVFAGYGIQENKYHWNDLARVNLKGKIAVVLAREPRADEAGAFFEGKALTESASIASKAKAVADKNAVAMLVLTASREESDLFLGSQYPSMHRGRGGDGLPIPVAIVSAEVATRLLGRPVAEVRDEIDRLKRSDGVKLAKARARLAFSFTSHDVPVANVVARYRGDDPDLWTQCIVVGAHLDHLGVDDRGRVYRGADDNAGGICAVLEIAEAFAKLKPKTKRSIVFMAFTGEEEGLLGSAAYVKEPAVPMDKTFGMINLDIIARGRKTAIEATLPNESSFIEKLLPEAERTSGARLKVGRGGKQFFQRSDQYSFHQMGVPTVFFNEGDVTEDYHQPTDTIDKVLEDKVAAVAKLAFSLAYLSANTDLRGGLR